MSGVKFGVVVPVYNIGKYLSQCVDSILCQSYTNLNIVLVDDGSTDDSPDICDGYAAQDKRVKVIRQANAGVVTARKVGAAAVDCDYLACVDGDDYLAPDYFKSFAEIIEKYGPDIAMCGHFTTDGDKSRAAAVPIRTGYYSRSDIESEIYPILFEDAHCVSFPPMLWAKVFRKELLAERLDIDPRIKMGEDSACVKPCVYNAQSLYVTDSPLYFYRLNPESATNSRKPLDWDGPRLRGEHMERQVDMTIGDFKAQLDRAVTHSLFNVAVSQFRRTDKYGEIAHDIKKHISDDYYVAAVKNSRFKSGAGKLARFALRHKLVFLMKIYCKRKK